MFEIIFVEAFIQFVSLLFNSYSVPNHKIIFVPVLVYEKAIIFCFQKQHCSLGYRYWT